MELHGAASNGSDAHGVIASSHRHSTIHGACSSWRHPLTAQPLQGDPDGMALDVEGCLWVALNGGGVVVQFDRRSTCELRVLSFPVSKVASLCFGGARMRSLFVTSVAKGVDLSKEPLAGAVFVVDDVGVAGRPSNLLQGNFACDARAPTQLLRHQLAKPAAALRSSL